MSDENDKKMMNPAAFEAFIRELSAQMGEFEISKKQTTDFFNEAIRTVKTSFPNTENISEFEESIEDDRPWVDEDDE
tara:strand:- start:3632 stop:3862 length:231 start_codon:yes stop_codon:yes gene_type:complete